MVAINRGMVSIYIVPATTAPSALASSDVVKGEITNWSLGGGNQEIESVAAFGGFIDKEKPREQFELSMDVTPKIEATASIVNRWDTYRYGSTLKSTGSGDMYRIFIQAVDSSSYKSTGFDNCRSVTWEPNHSADDNMGGTMTWKFSPEDSLGSPNLATSNVAATALNFNA